MEPVFRMFAIAGLLTLSVPVLLAFQGEREWPLILGAIAVLLILPALHRKHRRFTGWSKETREHISRIGF